MSVLIALMAVWLNSFKAVLIHGILGDILGTSCIYVHTHMHTDII